MGQGSGGGGEKFCLVSEFSFDGGDTFFASVFYHAGAIASILIFS
jgi:hypothetical protein